MAVGQDLHVAHDSGHAPAGIGVLARQGDGHLVLVGIQHEAVGLVVLLHTAVVDDRDGAV